VYQQKDIVMLADHLPGLLNIPIALLADVLAGANADEVLAAFAKWANGLLRRIALELPLSKKMGV
jgi:hypothetical protein